MSGEHITALILAGGQSRRFGSDKASALLLGRPMLAWTAGAAAQVADRIVIAGRPGQTLPLLALPVPLTFAKDAVPGLGPVAGLLAGLDRVEGAIVLALSCDVPLVKPDLLRFLATRIAGPTEAALPVVAGHEQPLVAAYATGALRRAIEEAASRRVLRLSGAIAALVTERVPETALRELDPHLHSFLNANDRDSLAAIEILAAG